MTSIPEFPAPEQTHDPRELSYRCALKLRERCRDLYWGMRLAGHDHEAAKYAVIDGVATMDESFRWTPNTTSSIRDDMDGMAIRYARHVERETAA